MTPLWRNATHNGRLNDRLVVATATQARFAMVQRGICRRQVLKPQTMQKLRRYHYYLGVFFAPMIILFAFSGALQTFRLQEEEGWGSQPPAWIEWMATIHMDSKLAKAKATEAKAPETAQAAPGNPDVVKAATPATPEPPKRPKANKLPMQIFTVVMSVALLLSTCLGITIAFNTRATRRGSLVMLALGALVPLAVLYTA